MTLGEYVLNYRTSHGLSQRQFASMCGLSYGYISMLEKGVNNSTGAPIVPTLQTMRSLAGAMGTTIHKIATEVDDLYLDMDAEEKQPSVSEGLSEEESILIAAFRALPPDERQHVLSLLRLAAGTGQTAPASGEGS